MAAEVPSPSEMERRRARFRELAGSLPGAVVEGDQHLAVTVRGRKFAYWLDDHHGDGRVGVAVKAPPGVNGALIGDQPERYYLPAYVGPRGWVALRVDLGAIDWDEIEDLLSEAFRLTASKHLIAQLDRS